MCLTNSRQGVYNSPIIAKKGGMYVDVMTREKIKSNESYLVTVISQGRKELSNE